VSHFVTENGSDRQCQIRKRLQERRERGFVLDGQPAVLQGQSFGPELQAFVLALYFELRGPEEKIWELLNAQGIVISAGQMANILIKKQLALFAAERKAILAAGSKRRVTCRSTIRRGE
jgi:hypothetical protein